MYVKGIKQRQKVLMKLVSLRECESDHFKLTSERDSLSRKNTNSICLLTTPKLFLITMFYSLKLAREQSSIFNSRKMLIDSRSKRKMRKAHPGSNRYF